MVYIDLNRAFMTEMNAGSEYEGMILQSIANTFGGYFQSDKVILTIDNALYESGHFAFMKGEYLGVDMDWEYNLSCPRATDLEITKPTSKVHVYVIPTDEEMTIARDTAALAL
ncbi:Acetate kinase [bioreactor metagenome]|uniref:Acetate kinase n=1 Tax=bioreactor metagenome TaxID=1076179 RepID=A0A645C7B0_9ZZZZ